MNKTKLIALTLAAIYTQRVRDRDSPSGLINTHDGVMLHFSSSILNYLRDKEGKNLTRYDSKVVVKIAKQLWKRHKIDMDVSVLPNKDKTFSFSLARQLRTGAGAGGTVLVLNTFADADGGDSQSAIQTFRSILNLQAKAKKSKLSKTEKEERSRLLGHLERMSEIERVSGEVTPVAAAA